MIDSIRWYEATLYLPDGTKQIYEGLTDDHSKMLNRDLLLRKIVLLNGNSIGIDYTDPGTSFDKYGVEDIPSKYTMMDSQGHKYKVEFIYQDVEAEMTAWESATVPDPLFWKCPHPATYLKRLDVYKDDTYLYSRYYRYFHFPKEYYTKHTQKGCWGWQAANDHYLVDTFVLGPPDYPLPVDLSESSLDNTLDAGEPSDWWHFEPDCKLGCNDSPDCCGGCTCLPGGADGTCDPINNNDRYHVQCPVFDLHKIVTPHGMQIQYGYDYQTGYNPNICTFLDGSTEIYTNLFDDYLGSYAFRTVVSRTEYVEGGVANSRKDSFDFFEDGTTLGFVNLVTIDTQASGNTIDDSRCFYEGGLTAFDGSSLNRKERAYSLKQEYKFYTSDYAQNEELWKLWLPARMTSYSVKPGGVETEIERMNYTWSSKPSRIDRWMGQDYYSEKDVEIEPHMYRCSDGVLIEDAALSVPVLSEVKVVRDGIEYGSSLKNYDKYHFPTSITSTSSVSPNILSGASLAYTHISDDELYMLGLPKTEKSFYNMNGDQGGLNNAAFILKPSTGEIKSISSDGYQTTFEWLNGNLASVTDTGGTKNEFGDYFFGRPRHVSLGNGTVTAGIEYYDSGDVKAVTTASPGGGDLTVSYERDALGRVTKVTPPGSLKETTIDYHWEKRTTDSGGEDWNFYYVLAGVTTTTGDLLQESYFNGRGQVYKTHTGPTPGSSEPPVVSAIDMNPAASQIQPLSDTFANGSYTNIGYNACGGVYQTYSPGESENDYKGRVLNFSDAFGRPTMAVDMTYIDVGQSFDNNTGSRWTLYNYTSDADGFIRETLVGFNANAGFDTEASEETRFKEWYVGPGPDSLFLKRSKGPLEKDGGEKTGQTKTIEYSYTGRGDVEGVDVTGDIVGTQRSSYLYDGRGNLERAISPESGERIYIRDAKGRVSWAIVEDNHDVGVIGYTYDNTDRVKEIHLNGGASQTDYAFEYVSGTNDIAWEHGDDIGPSGPVWYSRNYDYEGPTGLPEIVNDSYHISYADSSGADSSFYVYYDYDDYGLVKSMNYNGDLKLAFKRDYLGRVTSISREDGEGNQIDIVKSMKYMPDSSLMQMEYGNNIVHDIFYIYEWGLVSDIAIYNGNSVVPFPRAYDDTYIKKTSEDSGNELQLLWREAYALGTVSHPSYLDNNLNPGFMFTGPQNIEGRPGMYVFASYDDEQRMTDVSYQISTSGSAWFNESYTYDTLGNRKSKVNNLHTSNNVTGYTYDYSTNRLQSVQPAGGGPDRNFKYDKRGNMVSSPGHDYWFDLLDRLTAVDYGIPAYFYTASGEKYLKYTQDEITAYFYAGGQLVCERTYRRSDFQLKRSTYYVYANGRLVAQY